ncbi:MAG: hypothetical protein ACOH2H_13760 [Cypionkella sp.]
MIPPLRSTIAQMLYPSDQETDFARVVAELETVLAGLAGDPAENEALTIEWDCDDLVCFDVGDTRILLASSEFGAENRSTCLTLSVGPPEWQCNPASHHAVLCSRLVERIQSRFVPAAILWNESPGPVDSDVLEGLSAKLPALPAARSRPQPAALPQALAIPDHERRGERRRAAVPALRDFSGKPSGAATASVAGRPEAWDWQMPVRMVLAQFG